MKFQLFDYLDASNKNDIKEWTIRLERKDRGKLNLKLDMLILHGPNLFPQVLTGTDTPGILKLRVKGSVQLRPMLCQGPLNHDEEFTLLIGAKERDSELVPSNADQKADERKSIIRRNQHRRRNHERIN